MASLRKGVVQIKEAEFRGTQKGAFEKSKKSIHERSSSRHPQAHIVEAIFRWFLLELSTPDLSNNQFCNWTTSSYIL